MQELPLTYLSLEPLVYSSLLQVKLNAPSHITMESTQVHCSVIFLMKIEVYTHKNSSFLLVSCACRILTLIGVYWKICRSVIFYKKTTRNSECIDNQILLRFLVDSFYPRWIYVYCNCTLHSSIESGRCKNTNIEMIYWPSSFLSRCSACEIVCKNIRASKTPLNYF